MSTQLYRIKRTGAQHVRWEWPNGEPVKGPRTELRGDGRFVPIKKHGGPAQKVVYGAHRVDRNTGLPVVGVRSHIKLTPEGAKALAHMDLEPIVGSGAGKLVAESGQEVGAAGAAGDPSAAGAGAAGITIVEPSAGERFFRDDAVNVENSSEPDPKAKVPEDWRGLSESRKRGLAAKIAGLSKDDVTAEQAVSIIEAHLAAGGSNT